MVENRNDKRAITGTAEKLFEIIALHPIHFKLDTQVNVVYMIDLCNSFCEEIIKMQKGQGRGFK
jgi:hypothetical protein